MCRHHCCLWGYLLVLNGLAIGLCRCLRLGQKNSYLLGAAASDWLVNPDAPIQRAWSRVVDVINLNNFQIFVWVRLLHHHRLLLCAV